MQSLQYWLVKFSLRETKLESTLYAHNSEAKMIREEIYVLERLLAFNLLKSLETIFKKTPEFTRLSGREV